MLAPTRNRQATQDEERTCRTSRDEIDGRNSVSGGGTSTGIGNWTTGSLCFACSASWVECSSFGASPWECSVAGRRATAWRTVRERVPLSHITLARAISATGMWIGWQIAANPARCAPGRRRRSCRSAGTHSAPPARTGCSISMTERTVNSHEPQRPALDRGHRERCAAAVDGAGRLTVGVSGASRVTDRHAVSRCPAPRVGLLSGLNPAWLERPIRWHGSASSITSLRRRWLFPGGPGHNGRRPAVPAEAVPWPGGATGGGPTGCPEVPGTAQRGTSSVRIWGGVCYHAPSR